MKTMTTGDCCPRLRPSILVVLFLLVLIDIAAAKSSIEINHGKISAAIKNSTLKEVLDEVQKKSSVTVKFYDVTAESKQVSATFNDLDLEDGLKRILRDNYVFYFIKDPQKGIQLSEIKIGSKSLQANGLIHETVFSYGSGLKKIGVFNKEEGAQGGPTSFCTGPDGTLYIADTVNNKIKIFSATGEFLSAISHKGSGPKDISLDQNGAIYIYDMNGNLYQYDQQGNPMAQIAMNESDWDTLGPMHVVDNQVLARANGVGDVVLATIDDDKLTSAQTSSEIVEPGVKGETSENRYTAVWHQKEKGAEVKITNSSSSSSAYIPLQDIVSAEVLGEDGSANFYVKTESSDQNNQIKVEVSKFDSSGAYAGTLAIPGTDYSYWSIKTLTVNQTGVVSQMMPGKNGVTYRSYQFK